MTLIWAPLTAWSKLRLTSVSRSRPRTCCGLRPAAAAAAEDRRRGCRRGRRRRSRPPGRRRRTGRPGRPPPKPPNMPARVVLLALLGVGERVVGGGDLLELLLRRGVVGVAVRVVLARQLAVRLLDLLVGRLLRDARAPCRDRQPQRLLLAHHDAGRPDQLLAEPVALLHHLDDGPGLGPLDRQRRERLVLGRVELLALRDRRPRPRSASSVSRSSRKTSSTPCGEPVVGVALRIEPGSLAAPARGRRAPARPPAASSAFPRAAAA